MRIDLAMAGAGPAELEVFGVDGRRVRTFFVSPGAAGERSVSWDGRDADGRDAPAGIYFVRLVAGGTAAMRRVVKLR
ncbi:MAG: T9SS type A sorting domain-containing protein [Candidatus Eisenbacteria bacterium]|uniref:T9SS type A sorting domain-containing protein n=1 Tax=Eiseniibacteriota bacterium TaxID=2212470 RepID=A0A849SGP5_UNCEI|nr:T9SS type A sorting domain-containing protein [Candidatus Eisenbacteria bacterium]